MQYLLYIFTFLNQHGNIASNPDVKNKLKDISCFPWNVRSSHRKCSTKKGVLKNFTQFTEKDLCQSLYLIKLQA